MDHQRLKPIKGASAREQTAFTMKTIKELLADELTAGAEAAEAEAKDAGEAATQADEGASKATTQGAPAAKATASGPKPSRPEVPKATNFPRITPAPEAPTEDAKPRTFLGRLFKG